MNRAAFAVAVACCAATLHRSRRQLAQARAEKRSAAADLEQAIVTYEEAADLHREGTTKLKDSRALVGEWWAQEFAKVNPDAGAA